MQEHQLKKAADAKAAATSKGGAAKKAADTKHAAAAKQAASAKHAAALKHAAAKEANRDAARTAHASHAAAPRKPSSFPANSTHSMPPKHTAYDTVDDSKVGVFCTLLQMHSNTQRLRARMSSMQCEAQVGGLVPCTRVPSAIRLLLEKMTIIIISVRMTFTFVTDRTNSVVPVSFDAGL